VIATATPELSQRLTLVLLLAVKTVDKPLPTGVRYRRVIMGETNRAALVVVVVHAGMLTEHNRFKDAFKSGFRKPDRVNAHEPANRVPINMQLKPDFTAVLRALPN
jgi:hypothetical protein